MKTILVVDSGGRGAVLADKYAQSKRVGKVLVVPGNDLIKLNIKKTIKIYPELKTTSVKEILIICKKEKVDLVDVNQDNAVEAGLVDLLNANGIKAIGPTKSAGQIEWDKSWSRDFMARHNIPHPSYKVCSSIKEGKDYIKSRKGAYFIKASGLAGGYGVIPAKNNQEAIEKISELKNKFKEAADKYLIEEWLVGEEFSSYVISDGTDFKIIGHAQDNKRLNNYDGGPNTGGIGVSSPPLVINANLERQIIKIFKQTFRSLREEGRPYKGILYLGGMVVDGKVFVIEFNSRWGDPEAEAILPGILNDYYKLNEAALKGRIKKVKIKKDNKYRILVTACANGYPVNLDLVRDKQIFGVKELLKLKGIKIFSSGVKEKNNSYFVGGGRLLHIVADGKNVLEARSKAYQAISLLSVEGNNLHYRTDIGWRDLERYVHH